ncbi:ComF family protein [Candidatus Methylocalor cossyra]|uniref:ComF family protein n=1 Tax=Candidatus Methylocalor cossyra TaxID=3108543 RepID=UPI0032B2533A
MALCRQLRTRSSVNDWPNIIQDWLYPPTCLLCGDPGQRGRDLCRPCADALPYLRRACPRCALPHAEAGPCAACRADPPAFDRAFALFHYQAPVDHLIRALKFGARHPCARLLGTLLADGLEGRGARPEALIPVPLHARRYRQRGFNQTVEIARTVARRLGITLDLGSCRRVRATAPQAQLSARERHENLRAAFAVRPGVGYRHVAIIDDVVTTGATANALAQALRDAGVETIEVWSCARAGR